MNFVPDVYPDQTFTVVPIIPAAMANGKVLFIGLTLGLDPDYYLGGGIYEWDPATSAFALVRLPASLDLTKPNISHAAEITDLLFSINTVAEYLCTVPISTRSQVPTMAFMLVTWPQIRTGRNLRS